MVGGRGDEGWKGGWDVRDRLERKVHSNDDNHSP